MPQRLPIQIHEMPVLLQGQHGQYTLLKEDNRDIPSGGMGVLYKARKLKKHTIPCSDEIRAIFSQNPDFVDIPNPLKNLLQQNGFTFSSTSQFNTKQPNALWAIRLPSPQHTIACLLQLHDQELMVYTVDQEKIWMLKPYGRSPKPLFKLIGKKPATSLRMKLAH